MTTTAEDIAASLIRQTTSHKIAAKEGGDVESDKPITMVLVKEGIMKIRRTQVGTFRKLISDADKMLATELIPFLDAAGENAVSVAKMILTMKEDGAGLRSADEFPAFTLALPKIPMNLLHQTIDFFRKVYVKQGTEAAVLIRWNPREMRYYVEVPDQDLSGGGVKYKADHKNTDPIIIDIHSHHTMSPFFSSVDDGDEKSTQFYGVVGHIDVSHPAVNIRARMDSEDICSVRPDLLFDMEVSPEEWMAKIKEPPKTLYIPKSGRDWTPPPDYPEEVLPDDRPWYEGDRHGKKKVGAGEREERSSSTSPEGLFDDPLLAEATEAIWAGVEREIYDYPGVFSDRANIDVVRDMLIEKLDDLDIRDISRR